MDMIGRIITIIWFLMVDFYYLITLFFVSVIRTAPVRWSRGINGTVVFLPGFGARDTYYWYLCEFLNSQGYTVITVPRLGQNTLTIMETAKLVLNHLHDLNITGEITLIGHSKGGVVAKYLLDHESSLQIKKCITLAAPYGGSYLGYLRICNLHEFMPSSEVVSKIRSLEMNNEKIHQIVADVDNFVIPRSSLLLPGIHIYSTHVIGHTRLHIAPETYQIILQILSA